MKDFICVLAALAGLTVAPIMTVRSFHYRAETERLKSLIDAHGRARLVESGEWTRADVALYLAVNPEPSSGIANPQQPIHREKK